MMTMRFDWKYSLLDHLPFWYQHRAEFTWSRCRIKSYLRSDRVYSKSLRSCYYPSSVSIYR